MAIDTFMSYVGLYESVDAALADYEAIKELHREADLMDAYDAAVIERRADGKVKILKKHETPTRVGSGVIAGTTAGGTLLGAVAGHAAAGMSRSDLKELGEHLDKGNAGLIVVGSPTWVPGSRSR